VSCGQGIQAKGRRPAVKVGVLRSGYPSPGLVNGIMRGRGGGSVALNRKKCKYDFFRKNLGFGVSNREPYLFQARS
jgi:hypothetical protein